MTKITGSVGRLCSLVGRAFDKVKLWLHHECKVEGDISAHFGGSILASISQLECACETQQLTDHVGVGTSLL